MLSFHFLFSTSLIVLGRGSRVYVLFFLGGENCPLNVKLSNSSKKIQVNKTSAQIWENIHLSFHLIRKIILWVVSHAALQQTMPSLATEPGITKVTGDSSHEEEKSKRLRFLMPAAVWTTFGPSCTIDNALNWAPWSVTQINTTGVHLDKWDPFRGSSGSCHSSLHSLGVIFYWGKHNTLYCIKYTNYKCAA